MDQSTIGIELITNHQIDMRVHREGTLPIIYLPYTYVQYSKLNRIGITTHTDYFPFGGEERRQTAELMKR